MSPQQRPAQLWKHPQQLPPHPLKLLNVSGDHVVKTSAHKIVLMFVKIIEDSEASTASPVNESSAATQSTISASSHSTSSTKKPCNRGQRRKCRRNTKKHNKPNCSCP